MKIVFIADFFTDQVLGGGELNNEELIGLLVQDGHQVKKVNSAIATRGFIEDNRDNYFIIVTRLLTSLSRAVGLSHVTCDLNIPLCTTGNAKATLYSDCLLFKRHSFTRLLISTMGCLTPSQ